MKMSDQLKRSGSLLDATSAIGNWRALALFAASTVAAVLVFGLLVATQSAAGVLLGAVLGWLLAFYGVNAVGIMLMDATRDGESRTPMQAVAASLLTSHRLLLVGLLAFAGLLALLIGVAILLLLCKLPVIGPLLFAVVMPLSALLLGLTLFTLAYVFYPLAASAIWSGTTVMEAAGNLLAIARKRLVAVVLQEVVLMLIVFFVALILLGIVFSGLGLTTMMSAGIVGGGEGGLQSLGMMAMGMGSMGMGGLGGGGGYVLAGGLGTTLLLALAGIVPGLIALQGFCQIYLSSLEGLDSGDARRVLAATLQKTQEKMREAREKVEAQARRPVTPAAVETPVSPSAPAASAVPAVETSAPVAPAAAAACPACRMPVEPDDVFCGHCGQRIA
ncbi:hypothetical protein DAI18_16195 [Microvirgula aerodenitrificans]|uniref:Zinc ribbon domain-containing protein n=1 Tax=Microvirgula aerodenitrificans TaxID=57480 RepID=A0A2S0PDK0_9NEIS|nr:hypothetical protein [Microvirgula aerodenitrificans]AVY95412.1 hypothetical protein DAI18_16195 [Microvirgula aerodenitrificans]